jgi:hypothetical protein
MKPYKRIFKESSFENIFARKRYDRNYDILYVDDGFPVTRLDANVYPVDSNLSARYEHPEGIVLSREDVFKLRIDIEN